MTIITLPPEVEGPLEQEARRYGTTPELLAVDCLRKLFTFSGEPTTPAEGQTLFDFLTGYSGTVDGTTEPLSENCGQRFLTYGLEKSFRPRAWLAGRDFTAQIVRPM